MHELRVAITFLTTIPLKTPTYSPCDLGRSAGYFPLVGFLIGGIIMGFYWLFSALFPPLMAATLAAIVWIGITGGLHLDGLADSCDGLLSSTTRDRRLQIMRDPHIGTFGVLGLILTILLKVVTLSLLTLPGIPQPGMAFNWISLTSSSGMAIILAASCGRWVMLLAARLPHARLRGLGASFSEGFKPTAYFFGSFVMILLLIIMGWKGASACIVGLAGALIISIAAMKRLGGITGDIFGFLVEIVELAVLMVYTL